MPDIRAKINDKKVIFCCPTVTRPAAPFMESLRDSVPLLYQSGWEEGSVYEIGCPYISAARAMMLRKALDTDAGVFVFLDHDLSWAREDLKILIETPGDVVAGNYRYKKPDAPEEYMGYILPGAEGRPIVRPDGAVMMHSMPAGFLKVTRNAVRAFMRAYPDLMYGEPERPHIDIFNHGARGGVWWGEDFSFTDRWRASGGVVWCVPHLDITHHAIGFDKETRETTYTPYPGNFHRWLATLPGGSLHKPKSTPRAADMAEAA